MLKDTIKWVDRALYRKPKNRPETEKYWDLLSPHEQEFATGLFSAVAPYIPEDMRMVCMLAGSVGRTYDRRMLGIHRRKPRDVDLFFATEGTPLEWSREQHIAFRTNVMYAADNYVKQTYIPYKKETVRFLFIVTSFAYATKPQLDMRSMHALFFNFFDSVKENPLEEMNRILKRKRSEGVILMDTAQRNSSRQPIPPVRR